MILLFYFFIPPNCLVMINFLNLHYHTVLYFPISIIRWTRKWVKCRFKRRSHLLMEFKYWFDYRDLFLHSACCYYFISGPYGLWCSCIVNKKIEFQIDDVEKFTSFQAPFYKQVNRTESALGVLCFSKESPPFLLLRYQIT